MLLLRRISPQEFLEISGVPHDDALAQASFNMELRLLDPMHHLMEQLQKIHADVSTEADAQDEAVEWAIAGACIAQLVQEQMSHTLMERLSISGVEKKFLNLLSPETELVPGGVTVSERIEEIEQLHALVRSFSLMSSDVFALPPAEKQLFFEKVKEEGELSALKWLNDRE